MIGAEINDSESVFTNSLLKLVAKGSPIITEIQRLADYIPEVLALMIEIAFSERFERATKIP